MLLGDHHLQAYPLFKNCSDEEVLRFMTCVMPLERQWAKGQVLHDQDSPLTELYLVLEGRLALTRLGAGGQEVRAGELFPGQTYGQAMVFSTDQAEGQPDPFAIVALEPSRTLTFPAGAFYRQCAQVCTAHQKVIRNMLSDLAGQTQQLSRRVRILSAATLRGKIALLLLDEAGGRPAGQPFTLSYSREEMATFLAVARPSLSRALAGLKQEGLIDYNRRVFRILDPVRLEASE